LKLCRKHKSWKITDDVYCRIEDEIVAIPKEEMTENLRDKIVPHYLTPYYYDECDTEDDKKLDLQPYYYNEFDDE
jgi:hypothetical protein